MFLFFWLGQKVLNTGVGLVGMHSRKEKTGRKGREGLAGVERSRMDQETGRMNEREKYNKYIIGVDYLFD